MTSSLPPTAAWNAPASLRQSSWCTVSGSPDLSAAASAFASSASVWLQLQTLSVLPSRLIGFGLVLGSGRRVVFRDLRFFFLLFLLLVAEQKCCAWLSVASISSGIGSPTVQSPEYAS